MVAEPLEVVLVEPVLDLDLEAEEVEVEDDDVPDLEVGASADEKRLLRVPFTAAGVDEEDDEEEPDGPEFVPVRPEVDDGVEADCFINSSLREGVSARATN